MSYSKAGNTATLIESYKGYYNLRLIEETIPGRRIEVCSSGEEMKSVMTSLNLINNSIIWNYTNK